MVVSDAGGRKSLFAARTVTPVKCLFNRGNPVGVGGGMAAPNKKGHCRSSKWPKMKVSISSRHGSPDGVIFQHLNYMPFSFMSFSYRSL